MKEIEYAEFLRLALIKARDMDFDIYFEIFDNVSEHPYLKETRKKYHFTNWQEMQNDFSSWYLVLGSFYQRRFIQYVLNSK